MSASLINGVFFDGDYSQAVAVSGLETETPFPFQPDTLIFRQTFQQWLYHPLTGAPVWAPLAMNTSPAASGMDPAVAFSNNPKTGRGPYLVEETPRKSIGGNIVEWQRVWAHVPYVIYEFPAMNYQRQKYSQTTIPWIGQLDSWGNFHGSYRTFTSIEEWGEPLTGLVERRFICISSKKYKPDMIRQLCQLKKPFRIVKFNDERGNEHLFELGTEGIAEPSSITNYMGDILEVRTVFVQPADMGVALPSGGFSYSQLPAWNMNNLSPTSLI